MCPIASFLWAEFVFAQVLVLRVHCVSEIDLREWSVPPSQVLFCLFFAAFPKKRRRAGPRRGALRFTSLPPCGTQHATPGAPPTQARRVWGGGGCVLGRFRPVWGALQPLRARPGNLWPRALQRLCGRTGPTRKLVCPLSRSEPSPATSTTDLGTRACAFDQPRSASDFPAARFVSRVQARAP